MHGASTAAARRKGAERIAIDRLRHDAEKLRLDTNVSPVKALQDELDRTVRNIRSLEDSLAALAEGRLDATEVQLVALVQLAQFERRHLSDLARTGLAAKLDDRRGEVTREQADKFERVLVGILTDLGHDMNDQDVRTAIARNMRAASANPSVIDVA
jgi:hypothetical protein